MDREWHRLLAEIRRPFRTATGPSNTANKKKLSTLGQKGLDRVDPRLSAFTRLIPPELFKLVLDGALFQTSPSSNADWMFKAALEFTPIKTWAEKFDLEASINDLTYSIYQAFIGVAQRPEDNDEYISGSGFYTIKHADAELAERCRDLCMLKQPFLSLILRALDSMNFRDQTSRDTVALISNSIRVYPWNFIIFLLFFHGNLRSPALKLASENVGSHLKTESFHGDL